MRRNKIEKLIITIFLLVSIVSITGTGLEGSHQIQLDGAADRNAMQCFVDSKLLPDDNLMNLKVMEPGSALIRVQQMHTERSVFSYVTALSFLCALAFLSGLFLFTDHERFALFSNRNVLKVDYQVVYMEDEDGRKRIA